MSPRSPPRKTAGRVRSSFVQIDQSGIRLSRLSRRNNYINYLCFALSIHFTFFTWYLLRRFSGMFCVTDIAFYVLQKLTDFLAKQNHDLLQSAREYSWQEHTNYNLNVNTRKASYKNLNIFKRLNLLDECNRTAKVKSPKTGKT